MAKTNPNQSAAQNAVGKTTVINKVVKSSSVFRVSKPRKGKDPQYVMVLKRNPKHDKAAFEKKMKALEALGKQGKLHKVPGHKISRSGTVQAAYRKEIQDKINRISDPAKRKKAQAEFDTQDADHTHELQAGGQDARPNMAMLDSGVNSSVGSQIMNRLKHMPDGSTFQVAVSRW